MTSQENRTIAGLPIRVVRFEATFQGIPLAGMGCYYGGRFGAAQIVTASPRTLFDEYRSDFEELCDGLEMLQPGKPGESAGSAAADKSVGPETHSAASQMPAAATPPAVFILSSGEKIESSKYTLTAKSLTVEQGDKPARTIPISALNIDATVAANRARGVDIKIPTNKNQIMLGF